MYYHVVGDVDLALEDVLSREGLVDLALVDVLSREGLVDLLHELVQSPQGDC
jgi:hypothetical protein